MCPLQQDILKYMGDKTFLLYKHIQALLGRVAPMILDRLTISKLVALAVRTVNGEDCLDIRDGPVICLQLLQVRDNYTLDLYMPSNVFVYSYYTHTIHTYTHYTHTIHTCIYLCIVTAT